MQKIRMFRRTLSSVLFLFVCLQGTSGVRARAQQKPLTAGLPNWKHCAVR